MDGHPLELQTPRAPCSNVLAVMHVYTLAVEILFHLTRIIPTFRLRSLRNLLQRLVSSPAADRFVPSPVP